jgi:hypothetical protein
MKKEVINKLPNNLFGKNGKKKKTILQKNNVLFISQTKWIIYSIYTIIVPRKKKKKPFFKKSTFYMTISSQF